MIPKKSEHQTTILPSQTRHWQRVYTWAVERERGEDNMNINYDITGLLTAVWKGTLRSPWLSCLMLIWLVREKGGRGCISYMRELKESASSIQLDSWRCKLQVGSSAWGIHLQQNRCLGCMSCMYILKIAEWWLYFLYLPYKKLPLDQKKPHYFLLLYF